MTSDPSTDAANPRQAGDRGVEDMFQWWRAIVGHPVEVGDADRDRIGRSAPSRSARALSMTRRGVLLFFALGVIWGFPYLLIRIAVREVSPATLVFFRTAPAALLLLPFALREGSFRPLLAKWKVILAFTTIEIAVPWLLLSRAEQHVSSSLAGLLISMVPIVGAVLALAMRSEHRLDARAVVGVLIGFVGVALLVGVDFHASNAQAIVELFVCAVGYAVGPVIISRSLGDVSKLAALTVSFALTACIYAPYAFTHLPKRLTGEIVGSIAGLVIGCTVVAFLVFFALIAEIGPVRSTVVTYINPAVALILGVGLLGEHFTVGIALGFPTIILGSVLTARRKAPIPPHNDRSGDPTSTLVLER